MRRAFWLLVAGSLGFHVRSALQWAIERTGEHPSTVANLPRITRPRRTT